LLYEIHNILLLHKVVLENSTYEFRGSDLLPAMPI